MSLNKLEQGLVIYNPATQSDFSSSQAFSDLGCRAEISISKNKVQFCGFFTCWNMIENVTEGIKLNPKAWGDHGYTLPFAAIPEVTRERWQSRSSGKSKGLDWSLLSYSQRLLHLFVHHIADAHGRQHFHEVWGDASVKSWHSVFGHYSLKKADHAQLRGPLYRG